MQKELFINLWLQYRAGTISAVNRARLSAFIKSGGADLFLREWMQEQSDSQIDKIDKTSLDWAFLWEEIQNDILLKENAGKSRVVRMLLHNNYVKVAAVIIICIASWFFYSNLNNTKINRENNNSLASAQIKPGKTGAVLTLNDGTIVPFSDSLNGIVAQQDGNVISFNDGSVSFESSSGKSGAGYNTLTTPIARKINIVLADGTKVWLNAGSSLQFPTVFTGNQRRVSLTGEGYFEVAKNPAQPFIVAVKGGTEIKVLGTHFNINAYKGEGVIKTTLLEGAVVIKNAVSEKHLAPGQQVEVNELGTSMKLLSNVDVNAITAWKNGFFEFNGAPIETIMTQLARWYNVEVVYQDKIDGEFVARIPSNEPLQKVLDLLEATNQVHFIIENQKIIITK